MNQEQRNEKSSKVEVDMTHAGLPTENPPAYSYGQASYTNQVVGQQPYGAPDNNVVISQFNPSEQATDYLALSILSIFCCTILGIVSIFYSVETRNRNSAGSYAEARQASNNARNSAIAAIVIGLIVTPLYVCYRLGYFY